MNSASESQMMPKCSLDSLPLLVRRSFREHGESGLPYDNWTNIDPAPAVLDRSQSGLVFVGKSRETAVHRETSDDL
jgi:hypothetical protein